MTGHRPCPLTSASLLLIAATAAAGVPVPSQHQKWYELETPNLVIISDSREGRIAALASDMERMIEAVGRVIPSSRRQTSHVLVFLFGTRLEFLKYCEPLAGDSCTGLAGLYTKRTLGPLILADTTDLDRARSVAFHELTHVLLRRSNPGLPLWFEEGLAEIYSSLTVAGEEVRIGRPLTQHLTVIQQQGVPRLASILAADIESEVYTSARENPRYYAASWLLTHYLLCSDPTQRARLPQLLREIHAGQPAANALRTAYGVELADLERQLGVYARSTRFPVLQLKVGELSRPHLERPRPLARDEILARLASIYIGTAGDGATDAMPLLFEALRVNPNSVQAASLRGWALTLQGRPKEAAPVFERTLQLRSDDPDVLVLYARALMEDLAISAGTTNALVEPTALARPRDLLDQALRLAPEHLPALVAIGRSYVISAEDNLRSGIASLTRVLDLTPDDSEAALLLAQLEARAGSTERAEAVIARHLLPSSDPAARAAAHTARAGIAAADAKRLAQLGRYTDAVLVLDRALAVLRDRSLRKELERQRTVIDQQQKVESLHTRLSVMSPHAALAACDELLASITDPTLRSRVEHMRASLRSTASPTPARAAPLSDPRWLQPFETPSPTRPSAPQSRPRSGGADVQNEAQRLNQAVALHDKGDVDGALRLADNLAAHASNPAIRNAAADFAARVRAGKVTRAPTPTRPAPTPHD